MKTDFTRLTIDINQILYFNLLILQAQKGSYTGDALTAEVILTQSPGIPAQ